MRILMVGAMSGYAIERFYLKYFNAQDENVVAEIFTAQNLFLEYYRKSMLRKVMFRLGYRKIYDRINRELKKKISEFKPDILFVFKGMEIFPNTLKWAADTGIHLVNYNPDNPFVFSGRGSGNRNVTRSIPLFNLHLTYDAEVRTKMEEEYNIPTRMLPFGFDLSQEQFEACVEQEEVNKLCFLGNPDMYRADFIRQLAEAGIDIDVYGAGWANYIQHSGVSIHNTVYGDEFWIALRKYRVQLNLMRPHNPTSHNMRSFEVPGVGGILLAPATEDHLQFFIDGEEVFIYSDIASCTEIAKKLLCMPKEQADKVRTKARERSLNSGYSYKSRAEVALNYIQEMIGEKA